ncbi:MAG: phosphatidylglycerophosphatase A [Chitinispirillaceae bacterium]|jgi:phosphatidylglycerophosphatase A|nr:phosphatidylglycerophosphatase A [Chitinispirillaceae bacterium]
MGSFLNTWFRKIIASVGFIGYLPASGTFASAAVVAGLFFAKERFAFLGETDASGYWLFTLAVIAVSLFFSSHSRELFGKDDSGRIVIDEVAGQLITFLFVPLTLRTLVAGFLLFRFFDIVKPYPVHAMEQLDEGVGVTMDDVMAGVLANASLIAIIFVYHLIKAYVS